MRMFVAFVVASGLVGCASAARDNGNSDGFDSSDDSNDGNDDDDGTIIRPDANTSHADAPTGNVDAEPHIDAPPGMQILSQTTDQTIGAGGSVACGSQALGYTRTNVWIRVFDLTTLGITGPFNVSQVTFGVETSNQSQEVAIGIGTYAGTVGGTTLDGTPTALGNTTVTVPAGANQTITAPIAQAIPAGQKFYVVVQSEDGLDTGSEFYLGTSAGGESVPGYLEAADCDVTPPASLASLGAGAAIITVTGE